MNKEYNEIVDKITGNAKLEEMLKDYIFNCDFHPVLVYHTYADEYEVDYNVKDLQEIWNNLEEFRPKSYDVSVDTGIKQLFDVDEIKVWRVR